VGKVMRIEGFGWGPRVCTHNNTRIKNRTGPENPVMKLLRMKRMGCHLFWGCTMALLTRTTLSTKAALAASATYSCTYFQ